MKTGPSPETRRESTRTVIAVLCIVQFVDVLGVTEVLTAAPQILRSLAAGGGAASAVLTSYAMCFGGLLMLAARLGERFGHRRVLLGGIAAFAAGSLCAATAGSIPALVAGRCLQGVAAAVSRAGVAASPDRGHALGRRAPGGDVGVERSRGRCRGQWLCHRRRAHSARGLAPDVLGQPPTGRGHRRRRRACGGRAAPCRRSANSTCAAACCSARGSPGSSWAPRCCSRRPTRARASPRWPVGWCCWEARHGSSGAPVIRSFPVRRSACGACAPVPERPFSTPPRPVLSPPSPLSISSAHSICLLGRPACACFR